MESQIGLKREQIAELCRRYQVRRLALFGSAVREDFDPARSDLDFLVEFEPPPPGTYARTYFGLLAALQEVFGRPVDLAIESAIKNPYFRQSVEENQALLYAT
jgi:predicted nucleotidyltransferase